MAHHSISSQYITRNKINVTILDVIDPSHFVVKESPDLSDSSSLARNFLEAEAAMQKFYASVEPCFFQMPLKDAIIVVLHDGKFYRAKVIKILTLSAGHLFKVYLVDYGIECNVPRERIYEIEKDFLHHPFQAVKIELLGIEPISLVMDKITLTMCYGPVLNWDPSAVIYVKDLQKDMCSAFIEVQGIDDVQIYGKLFFCYESSPVKCINDDLISKSFAHFNEDCWKNIKTIESIFEESNKTNDAVQTTVFVNENPEDVSFADNLSETELECEDIKTMFINPADGKIIAQSTLTHNSPEKFASVDERSELEDELKPAEKIVTKSCQPESKSSLHFKEKSPETKAECLTQKHFQKLLNKKKCKSLIKSSTNNAACDSSIATMNKTMKNPPIPCENETISHFINRDETNLQISSANSVDLSSNDQNVEKYIDAKTEEKLRSENTSLADCLLAEKRLMKLQLKKKSLSPIKAGSINHSGVKSSPVVAAAERNIPVYTCTEKMEDSSQNKIEISHNHLDANLPNEIKTQVSEEIIKESSEHFPIEENESMPISENLRQLEKLQKKVKLKQKKKSLEVLEKFSNENNQYEELATSCDCDSDSGLNSFSSSSSTSDRIER